MEASSEVIGVSGLDDPQTILVSSDGGTLYTGDSAGVIASWIKQSDGTFRLNTQEQWFAEPSVVGGPDFGQAVDLSLDASRNLKVSSYGALASIANAGATTFVADTGSRTVQAFDNVTGIAIQLQPAAIDKRFARSISQHHF
ncbi:MAG: hypothetical protein R3C05_29830 [Pirellulaceae bacterium]